MIICRFICCAEFRLEPTRPNPANFHSFPFLIYPLFSLLSTTHTHTHTHTHMYTHTTTTFSWERVRKMEVERKRDPIE